MAITSLLELQLAKLSRDQEQEQGCLQAKVLGVGPLLAMSWDLTLESE